MPGLKRQGRRKTAKVVPWSLWNMHVYLQLHTHTQVSTRTCRQRRKRLTTYKYELDVSTGSLHRAGATDAMSMYEIRLCFTGTSFARTRGRVTYEALGYRYLIASREPIIWPKEMHGTTCHILPLKQGSGLTKKYPGWKDVTSKSTQVASLLVAIKIRVLPLWMRTLKLSQLQEDVIWCGLPSPGIIYFQTPFYVLLVGVGFLNACSHLSKISILVTQTPCKNTVGRGENPRPLV